MMTDKEREEFIKATISTKQADLLSSINQVHDTLTNLANLTKPRISEEVFLKYFLPYLSGDLNLSDKVDELRDNWIKVAGNLTSPIDIMSATSEVLFTVPPMVRSDFINSNNDNSGGSIAEIVRMATLMGGMTPIAESNHLISELGNKAKQYDDSGSTYRNIEDIKTWDLIFKRYNKKEALARLHSLNKDIPLGGSQVSTEEDDLSYDFD